MEPPYGTHNHAISFTYNPAIPKLQSLYRTLHSSQREEQSNAFEDSGGVLATPLHSVAPQATFICALGSLGVSLRVLLSGTASSSTPNET